MANLHGGSLQNSGHAALGGVQGYVQSAGAVASIAGLIAGGIGYVVLGPGLFLFAACVITVSALLAMTYRPQAVASPQFTEPSQNPE